MNKSKEKIKENPIIANRAIYMANPCHIIDKVVPLYWLTRNFLGVTICSFL